MKLLYILRHAKSDWVDFSVSDFDRTLSERGERDVPKMGDFLAKKGTLLDRIISSSAVRAKTTALKIAPYVKYSVENIIFEQVLYLAEQNTIKYLIQNQPDEVKKLMIVGHNPGLTDIVNTLISTKIDEIPTAGIVALRFSTEKWSEISKENATFWFFESPKLI